MLLQKHTKVLPDKLDFLIAGINTLLLLELESCFPLIELKPI